MYSLFQQHIPLCLASASPRRQEFLESYGLKFKSYSPNIVEQVHSDEEPHAFIVRMAQEKAWQAQKHFPDSLILAGDTLVFHQNQLLGKPESPDAAVEMLRMLSGSAHEVCSAYYILDAVSGKFIQNTVSTILYFRTLSEESIQWYVHTVQESLDKAGAYSIQGVGGMWIQSIEGSYMNVVGFPMAEILEHLLEEGWISYF